MAQAEVLTPPKPFITQQNCRELQAKAAEARVRNRLAREANSLAPASPLPISTPAPAVSNWFVHTQARRIERAIAKLVGELVTTTDAKEQQAKATALDRLYNTYADMTGIERRGVSRGTKRKSSQGQYSSPAEPEDQ